jgi:tRNA modification GTPase
MTFPVLALRFPNGHSYTGEESAELHLPGNVLMAQMTLEALYKAGARPAEPGEFTARAFFNGRLDLAEAEGVAATIAANNQRELDAARRLQAGELTRRLRPMADQLTQMLALVEAGIDFSEEDVQFLTRDDLVRRTGEVVGALRKILAESRRLEVIAHEPTVVLCGRPNAGKSTLLNTICGRHRAVVSPVAGTTRDLLRAEAELEHGIVHLIDTAGLEAEVAGSGEAGSIARQMRQAAQRAVEEADVLVLVHAAEDRLPALELHRTPDLVVRSKVDLADGEGVSCVTGQGIEPLRQRLDELAFARGGGERLVLNDRHRRQIEVAIGELGEIENAAPDELAAEHLRGALNALGEITGMVCPDDVLGRVFATFCIGK